MAQEIVGIKIEVDGSSLKDSIGNLREEIIKTKGEINSLNEKYGRGSKESEEAVKRLKNLQQQYNEKQLALGKINENTAKTLSALSTAYAGLQGALELTGFAANDSVKQLAKIQSALAIGESIKSVFEFRSSIVATFDDTVKSAKRAFNAIRAGIGSTGIGLLVIALGSIVAYWDDIKEAVSGVSEEQKKLNKATKDNLDAQQEKLDAIDEQDNILKAQGKSEREILQIKMKQTDETIQAAETNLQNLKSQRDGQIAIAKRNKDILQGLIALVTSPITLVLGAVDLIGKAVGKNFGLAEGFTGGLAKLVFDPEEVASEADKAISEAEKGLTKLKNQRAGYQLAIKNIDKQAADKAKKDAETEQQRKEKERQEEFQRQQDQAARESAAFKIQQEAYRATLTEEKQKELAIEDAYEEKRSNLIRAGIYDFTAIEQEKQIALENLKAEYAEKEKKKEEEKREALLKIFEKYKEREKEIEDKSLQAKIELEDAKFAAAKAGLDLLGSLVGENEKVANSLFVLDKALAIGKIIVDTQREIAGVAAANAGFGVAGIPITAKQILAAKIRAGVGIATIVASSISKFKKSASSSVGGGGSTSSAAPIAPPLPQAALTQLDQSSINKLGSATNRAYVVESDITNSQEKITRINRAARIG